MSEIFLSNHTKETFINHIKESLKKCDSFSFTVSFIKDAGLLLLKKDIEAALERGASGKIITSTYQNFTDIPALEYFLELTKKFDKFNCHLDYNCFDDNGFHSKGYIFENENDIEIIVGSTNITRFALLKNVEWNVSIYKNKKDFELQLALDEFKLLWDQTYTLSESLICKYKGQLDIAIEKWDMDYISSYSDEETIKPNIMQRRALKEIRRYRDTGANKALVVAATASGKTYLAAFDAMNFGAHKLLFIVHRDTILEDAKNTFRKVFGMKRTYGLYTGENKESDKDFVFATNASMSRHLQEFDKEEFDYIVYDECHHITADTYKSIMEYFKPRFSLGLTATPERMDNEDVFEMFENNVPYELRLRDALLNNLVVPFKYYGIRDRFVDYSDREKKKFIENAKSNENCDLIVREIESHRQPGKLKAVGFCKSIEHAKNMADSLKERGYVTTALTGNSSTGERLKAYTDLQNNDNPLEIIFTVDILNEGVDIPGINMVLFLRPTESSTIFIQQLGRGLRKCKDKPFLTVLDFIGNSYDRSVQIAFALGTLTSSTYIEKPLLRSLIINNFIELEELGIEIVLDELSKEEILSHIEKTNFNNKKLLAADYYNFKKCLGMNMPPKHVDYLSNECAPNFIKFIKSKINNNKNKCYYNFLKAIDPDDSPSFNKEQVLLLEKLSDMLPITRKEEFEIVKYILESENNKFDLNQIVGPRITCETLLSAVNNLRKQDIIKHDSFELKCMKDTGFVEHLKDLIEYGLNRYENEFGDFKGKFKKYANYYKEQAQLEINGKQYSSPVGTLYDVNNYVTYIFIGLKKDEISNTDFAYKDKFISDRVFQWESVNNTTKTNTEGKKLLATKTIHLFVRKMENEDGVILPFTYFGTGHFENCRESSNNGKPTLLFDVILDEPVLKDYWFDFNISANTF